MILENSKMEDIQRTGLGELLIKVRCITFQKAHAKKDLNTCLTYHSDPDLVHEALFVLLELIPFVYGQGQKSSECLERVMDDGILKGLVYSLSGNVALIQVC